MQLSLTTISWSSLWSKGRTLTSPTRYSFAIIHTDTDTVDCYYREDTYIHIYTSNVTVCPFVVEESYLRNTYIQYVHTVCTVYKYIHIEQFTSYGTYRNR